MRYFILLMCALALVLAPGMSLAQKGGNSSGSKGKGPNSSSSAYEHASDNANFIHGEDWQGGKKSGDEELIELDEDGKKIKAKEKGKKGQKGELYNVSGERGEQNKNKGEDEKARVWEEMHSEETIREKTRMNEDFSDGEKKRSEQMELLRERILHRTQE